MIVEVHGFGIPGYETCRVIWEQHPQLLDAISGGGSMPGIEKILITPRRTYLTGQRGISIAVDGLDLFKAPSFKMPDIKPKGAIAKALKTAYRYCLDHNNWYGETPRQYESRITEEEVLLEDSRITIRLAPLPSEQPKTSWAGAAIKKSKQLTMNAAYHEKKPEPFSESQPAWDDDRLDEQIDYRQEDEDIPF